MSFVSGGVPPADLLPLVRVTPLLSNLLYLLALAGSWSAVWSWRHRAGKSHLLSLLVVLLAAMAFFVPPMGLTDDEELDKDALYLMQQYLKAAAEREQEEKEAEVVQDNSDNTPVVL